MSFKFPVGFKFNPSRSHEAVIISRSFTPGKEPRYALKYKFKGENFWMDGVEYTERTIMSCLESYPQPSRWVVTKKF